MKKPAQKETLFSNSDSRTPLYATLVADSNKNEVLLRMLKSPCLGCEPNYLLTLLSLTGVMRFDIYEAEGQR